MAIIHLPFFIKTDEFKYAILHQRNFTQNIMQNIIQNIMIFIHVWHVMKNVIFCKFWSMYIFWLLRYFFSNDCWGCRISLIGLNLILMHTKFRYCEKPTNLKKNSVFWTVMNAILLHLMNRPLHISCCFNWLHPDWWRKIKLHFQICN